MTAERPGGSEGIRGAPGMDILELADEFGIHPDMLERALEDAQALLRTSRENVRPANKRALRGIAKTLAATLDLLSAAAVRERLVEAAVAAPDPPEDDRLAYYLAWCAARDRVDHALAGAQDLLALVHAGEAFKGAAGRPQYDHWAVAIGSLLEFWTRDLGRGLTISGHPAEPRGVTASPAVRFVLECMRVLDAAITEQACRTILQKLCDQDASPDTTR